MYPFVMRAAYFLLFLILFFYAIITAKDFLAPIAFGLLLASLIFPICRLFCRIGIPKGLSIFISIIIMGVFFTGVSIFFVNEISNLAGDFPTLKEKALENVNEVSVWIEDKFGVAISKQKDWLNTQISDLFSSSSEMMNNFVDAAAGTIFKVLIIPVFMFYLLFYRERFQFFVMRVVPDHEKQRADKILSEISFVSQRYLGGAFVVVLILSFINSVGLSIIGLRYAILFGVISAFFNFIPYFGTWIGAVFPFTFALLTGDSPNMALYVLLLFAAVQFTENNVLTPNITGGYVRLNPFITILALIAGGMVWGVAGMLLVIPFIASIKIIFENFEQTSALAFVLARPESEPYSRRVRKIKAFLFGKSKAELKEEKRKKLDRTVDDNDKE
ncbi:MAG: AI-2E family transporter [Bacteroidota bacterium]